VSYHWHQFHPTWRALMEDFSFWDWLACEGFARLHAHHTGKEPRDACRAMAIGAYLAHRGARLTYRGKK
jgi:hypothetical protein